MKAVAAFFDRHKHTVIPLLLLLIAFSIRMKHLDRCQDHPHFIIADFDEKLNIDAARKIGSGSFLPQDAFKGAPLYKYVLAGLLLLTGEDLHRIRILQVVLGSVVVVLLYFLALHFFHVGYAFLTGILGAFTGYLVFYSAMLLTPVPLVFLSLLFLLLLLRAMDNGSMPIFVIAGFLAGLAVITTGIFIILLFGLALVLIIRKQISTRQFLALVIPSLLLFSIVSLSYYSVHDDFIFLSSETGIQLYKGNNHYSSGLHQTQYDEIDDQWEGFNDSVTLAEKSVGRDLSPGQISLFYMKKTVLSMVGSPLEATGNLVSKLLYYFHGFNFSDDVNFDFFTTYYGYKWIPTVPFGVLSAFAVLGIVFLIRSKNDKQWSIILLCLLFLVIAGTLFSISTRARVALLPFLILITVYVIKTIVQARGQKQFKHIVSLLVLLAIFYVPLFDSSMHFADIALTHGLSHRNLGNYQESDRFLEIASTHGLASEVFNTERGLNALRRDDIDEASLFFNKALATKRDYAPAKLYLAMISLREKKYQQSYNLLSATTAKEMIKDLTLMGVACDAYFAAGKQKEFFAKLDTVTLEEKHFLVLTLRGDNMVKNYYFPLAQQLLTYLLSRGYDNKKMLNNLAIAEYQLGNKDRAMTYFGLSGTEEAKQNLEKIRIMKENEEESPIVPDNNRVKGQE